MPVLTTRFIFEPGLISDLIEFATDSLWIHAEGMNRTGDKWVGAHAGTGVQARELDWCKPTRERRYEVTVTDEQFEAAMIWQESKIGEPYDYLDIFGLALHLRIGSSKKQTICSAFELGRYMAAGIYPLNCLENFTYMITPETLHLSPIFLGKCVYTFPKVP